MHCRHGRSLVQFLLGVHFEGLVSLLLLFDPHQVVLRTLLQNLLILGRDMHRVICQPSKCLAQSKISLAPKLDWPSWSPPGRPSCSHTSWKGRQRSAQPSWGRRSLDPALLPAAWQTYCRRWFSAVAHPLQTNMKSQNIKFHLRGDWMYTMSVGELKQCCQTQSYCSCTAAMLRYVPNCFRPVGSSSRLERLDWSQSNFFCVVVFQK